MKIYLSAKYARRVELSSYRDQLRSHDFVVTSRWLGAPEAEISTEQRGCLAEGDWNDLRAADTVIVFTEPVDSTASRGGRHVEFGLALALDKRTMVVGPRENVFHCLPQVEVFETWLKCLKELVSHL
jgi:nucleoside 2-deoxyribosyltransferase